MSSTNKILAVVDSTGMVWMNPSDVDPMLVGLTPLYTATQVEQALANMERRMKADAEHARATTMLDIEASAEAAKEVEIDELAFSDAMNKLDLPV